MQASILRALLVLVVASTVGLASGCAATVTVKSNPPGAKILVDGTPIGQTTPATIDATKLPSDTHKILVLADGYKEASPQVVTKKLSMLRVAGAVLAPIPMLIVFLIDGFSDYDPSDVEFALEKK